jgi:hypothetical protein
MLNTQQAQAYIQQHAAGNSIVPQDVEQLLQAAHGTTFAQIVQVTPVAVAAAWRDTMHVRKVTSANVQLFANLKSFDVYRKAVMRSANKLGQSNTQDIADFVPQETWFHHTNTCFSVVQHNTDPSKFYLYAIYNTGESELFLNNIPASKQQVAQYLTPSAAKELLNPRDVVENKSQNVTHDVIVRTTLLSNIVQIRAMGSSVQV